MDFQAHGTLSRLTDKAEFTRLLEAETRILSLPLDYDEEKDRADFRSFITRAEKVWGDNAMQSDNFFIGLDMVVKHVELLKYRMVPLQYFYVKLTLYSSENVLLTTSNRS